MNIRLKTVFRNTAVLALLFFIFFMRSGLYLTPLSAHEHSERSIHYGPSEVVHIEGFARGKYILGKYDRWVSCNTIKRQLFFFWGFGNQVTGFENDKSKALDFTWSGSELGYKLYGIINNDCIKKVELTLNNSIILIQTDFYDDLFLFTWKEESGQSNDSYFKVLKGYDAENNLVFESDQK